MRRQFILAAKVILAQEGKEFGAGRKGRLDWILERATAVPMSEVTDYSSHVTHSLTHSHTANAPFTFSTLSLSLSLSDTTHMLLRSLCDPLLFTGDPPIPAHFQEPRGHELAVVRTSTAGHC